MNHRIHILRASGSGATTLGKALADTLVGGGVTSSDEWSLDRVKSLE